MMQRFLSPEEVALDSGLPMEQKTLSSFDGTPIVYRVRRAGPRWLVIANGYAGTFVAWRTVLPRLDPKLSVLIWDYRGMYLSGTPKDKHRMTIEDDSRDLEALAAAEEIPEMVLAGWSVGVQVALEHYRRRPEQVEALILHNGAPERVLHTSVDGRIAPFVLVPLVHATQFLYPLVHLGRPLLRRRAAAELSYRLGIVKRNVWHIHQALKALTGLHMGTYSYMVLRADEHRTSDMWSTIRVPTLITYGSSDLLSPERLALMLHQAIPESELFCIEGGTHYSNMEYPEVVASRIQQFLDRLGPPRPPKRPQHRKRPEGPVGSER